VVVLMRGFVGHKWRIVLLGTLSSYALFGLLYFIADFNRSLLSLDVQFVLAVAWALIEAAILVWSPRIFLLTLPQFPGMSYVLHTIFAQWHCLSIGIHPGCGW
jgi:hypothetical protein